MARQGATVVVTARRLDSSPGQGGTLRGAAEAIEGEGGRAFAIPASISDPAGAKALIEQAVEAAGRLDILVNNAATYPEVRIEDMDVEEWQEAVDINLNAIFYLTHYALPIMAEQGGGRIVNVSSEMAVYRRPTRVAYTATKAAVDAFSLALSEETRAQNVEVNVWTPGFVRTDMSGSRATDGVETVGESFLWMLAQEPMALTGQVCCASLSLGRLGGRGWRKNATCGACAGASGVRRLLARLLHSALDANKLKEHEGVFEIPDIEHRRTNKA